MSQRQKAVVANCNHLVGYDGGNSCPFTQLIYRNDSLKNYKGERTFRWCPLCGEKLTP